jgi:hypothetical protein
MGGGRRRPIAARRQGATLMDRGTMPDDNVGDGSLGGIWSAPPAPPRRPVIVIEAGHLPEAATEAEAALVKSGLEVYRQDRRLVRPVQRELPASKDRITMGAGLEEICPIGMFDLVSQAATFQKYSAKKRDYVDCDAPDNVGRIILSRVGQWSFPMIAGVITTPTLRPDGSVLSTHGYDPATRLFLMTDPNLRMPTILNRPTRADAEAQLEVLRDLLAGFPYVADLDKAVGLSSVLTTVTRAAFDVAPMHAFSAPSPGSGKSHHVDTIAAISSGRPCPVAAASGDPREAEKQLTTHLIARTPLISLDNVDGEIRSSLLCQAIERKFFTPRPFGTTDHIEVENTHSIMCTGNNLVIAGDLNRRTLLCRLDAEMERPELRQFKFDPFEKVLSNRGRYVASCLTIVRAYLSAGSPGRLPKLASFGGWSDTVRSALVWLGCPDPAESIEHVRAEDPDELKRRAIFDAWRQCVGIDAEIPAADLIQRAQAVRHDPDYGQATDELLNPELLEALGAVAEDRRGKLDADALGKWLRTNKGRIAGGLRLENRSNGKKAAKWYLRRVGP